MFIQITILKYSQENWMRNPDTNKTELVHYKFRYTTKDWNGLEDERWPNAAAKVKINSGRSTGRPRGIRKTEVRREIKNRGRVEWNLRSLCWQGQRQMVFNLWCCECVWLASWIYQWNMWQAYRHTTVSYNESPVFCNRATCCIHTI